jgi:hypothetical protein
MVCCKSLQEPYTEILFLSTKITSGVPTGFASLCNSPLVLTTENPKSPTLTTLTNVIVGVVGDVAAFLDLLLRHLMHMFLLFSLII